MHSLIWNFFTYLLQLFDQRSVDLAVHRGENTLLSKGSIQNLLDSNRARNSDCVQLVTTETFYSKGNTDQA